MLIAKRTSSLIHRLNIILLFALTFIASGILLSCVCTPACAQKNVPIERIVEGQVVNKSGAPIAGAVVYLKNSRSNAVKTYIADDSGHFRFGELSQDTDYVLWAESNGVRSKSKEISSFDSESNFHFTLKINVSKPVSLDGPSISDTGLTPPL